MTKQNAIDWIEAHCPTITEDGVTKVVVEHDADRETETPCSICGTVHGPARELHEVAALAELYHEAIGPELPEQASEAADAAIAAAQDRGDGHERFFRAGDG